jgi:2'-5' RNA ligase
MGAEQARSLEEQRAALERQLERLKAQREDRWLYMPGVTIISDQAPMPDEQIDLQIEELQAAIAQIEEAIRMCSEHGC